MASSRAKLLRSIFFQGFRTPDWRHDQPPPVVSVQEFFVDNTDNSSIAINLIDHPGIQFFHDAIAAIEARADVQAVLVNIYDLDPIIDGGWPYAENVHILTSASEDEVQQWAVYLRSDGAMEGWPYGVPNAARKAEPGQKWWSLSWD